MPHSIEMKKLAEATKLRDVVVVMREAGVKLADIPALAAKLVETFPPAVAPVLARVRDASPDMDVFKRSIATAAALVFEELGPAPTTSELAARDPNETMSAAIMIVHSQVDKMSQELDHRIKSLEEVMKGADAVSGDADLRKRVGRLHVHLSMAMHALHTGVCDTCHDDLANGVTTPRAVVH